MKSHPSLSSGGYVRSSPDRTVRREAVTAGLPLARSPGLRNRTGSSELGDFELTVIIYETHAQPLQKQTLGRA